MPATTRRQVLGTAGKAALGGVAALAALGPAGAVAAAAGGERWGMLVDLTRCIGCNACSVACKAENDVPLGVFRRRVRPLMAGSYPDTQRAFVPISCFHCEKPACLEACKKADVGAIYKTADGFVVIDQEKCEKKKRCTFECPYRNVFINPVDDKAQKCTFCEHRVKQGVAPACVQTCVGGALTFGDLNDPNSGITKAIKANKAKVLRPDKGTSPSMYYIGLDADLEKQMVALLKKKRGQVRAAEMENDI